MRGATHRITAITTATKISTHAPLAGRDSRGIDLKSRLEYFNPRAPCGARRDGGTGERPQLKISTHAPLAGRDRIWPTARNSPWDFNPRAPCGARQLNRAKKELIDIFQPTRPLRGATEYEYGKYYLDGISTHAPLAGRDVGKIYKDLVSQISTHAPLAGRDGERVAVYAPAQISTHAPLAGRDAHRPRGDRRSEISTHAPLAGRDEEYLDFLITQQDFNPRAPCGARPITNAGLGKVNSFQPTRPLRGATWPMQV